MKQRYSNILAGAAFAYTLLTPFSNTPSYAKHEGVDPQIERIVKPFRNDDNLVNKGTPALIFNFPCKFEKKYDNGKLSYKLTLLDMANPNGDYKQGGLDVSDTFILEVYDKEGNRIERWYDSRLNRKLTTDDCIESGLKLTERVMGEKKYSQRLNEVEELQNS